MAGLPQSYPSTPFRWGNANGVCRRQVEILHSEMPVFAVAQGAAICAESAADQKRAHDSYRASGYRDVSESSSLLYPDVFALPNLPPLAPPNNVAIAGN